MKRLKAWVAASAVTIAMAQGAQAQSVYGCEGLDGFHSLPSIEGANGVFYRVNPDMRNFHAFSDHTVEDVARLSQALAQGGTQLIYAPMPPKSMVMTDQLPQLAYDYGFEPVLAATVYEDMVKRLRERGVAVANLRQALVAGSGGQMPFFQADHRVNSLGTRLIAQAIAQAANGGGFAAAAPQPMPQPLAQVPAQMATAAPVQQPTASNVSFRQQMASGARQAPVRQQPAPQAAAQQPAPMPVQTVQTGQTELASDMRHRLQQHCMIELPKAMVDPVAAAPAPQGGQQRGGIVVVGTDYTGTPELGFAQALGQAMRGRVEVVSATGAGAYGAITAYMTSAAFEQARPRVLVWENPVYYNLASYGDRPMAELLAAARGTCRTPLQLQPGTEPNTLRAMLGGVDPNARPTLFFDSGNSTAAEARFTFQSQQGFARTRTVARAEGVPTSGRFYVPMTGLWPEGAQFVDIAMDTAPGASPRLAVCLN